MDEKRTKIGPTGPVRMSAAVATPRPTPAPEAADTAPPAPAPAAPTKTSYLPPQTDPLIGQTLANRYHIEKKLGEGGMGAVYLATHNLLEKQVALKVLHGELGRKADLVERFMQEAKSASRIRHENVIDISDFGTTPEGLVFFAMELLNGHDLHEDIARARLAGQLLPWSRSKRIFLQICGALSAAHRHGIVHRDLKPENIYLVDFLGDPDFVKLLDFGIAKLTEVEGSGDRKLTKTGMLFGTPEYMSPEQARGEHVDHRVDIYAMGCILFQLVTGRVPFEADNFMGVLSLHLTELAPVIPLEVFDRIGAPRELAGVIDQALAKDRGQRYQSIDDLANAVRMVCGDPPVVPGATGLIAAQRAPSVPAPPETKHPRATPLPGASVPSVLNVPVPSTAPPPSGRARTQWTGNLSVPEVDEPAQKSRSKLPLVLGAIAIAGGAAVAVGVLGGGKGAGAPQGPGSGPAPGSAVIAGGGSPVPAPPPDAGAAAPVPVPPPELALPERVLVTLDSEPRGAKVKDLVSGAELGATPRTFPVTPGRAPRQYRLSLRGYADAIVELVPDQAEIKRTAPLEKGAAGTVARPPRTPGTPPGTPGTPPGPTPGTPPGEPQIKPPPPPPKDPDDCPEPPCLKAFPGAGSAKS